MSKFKMTVLRTTPLFLSVLYLISFGHLLVSGASLGGHLEELVRDIRATIGKVSGSAVGQRSSLREGRRIENLPEESKQFLDNHLDVSPLLWWAGPSVCINRSNILINNNETTMDNVPASSSNSSGHAVLTLCRIVGKKRHCRTREAVNGTSFQEYSTTYECCKGFVLRNNQKCVLGNDTRSASALDDENEDDEPSGTDNLLGRFLEESIRSQALMLRALNAGALSNENEDEEQLMPVLIFKQKKLPTAQLRNVSQSSSQNTTSDDGSVQSSSRSDLHFSVTI